MQSLKIIVLCIFSAIIYGIAHDQITARICVEYFTIGHPPIFNTTSPTLLGLGWGIIATWWVGLLLGIPLALIAQVGEMPKLSAANLMRPIIILILCSALAALLAGIVGFLLARAGVVWLLEPMASKVPVNRHVAFLTDLWAHSASYLTGFLGGLGLLYWTWRQRYAAMCRKQATLEVGGESA